MRSQSQHLGGVPLGRKAIIRGGRICYVERDDFVPELDSTEEMAAKLGEKSAKPRRARKPRQPRLKHDVEYEKWARELRDRYLEEINSGRLLPSACDADAVKYDVCRALPPSEGMAPATLPLLDAA